MSTRMKALQLKLQSMRRIVEKSDARLAELGDFLALNREARNQVRDEVQRMDDERAERGQTDEQAYWAATVRLANLTHVVNSYVKLWDEAEAEVKRARVIVMDLEAQEAVEQRKQDNQEFQQRNRSATVDGCCERCGDYMLTPVPMPYGALFCPECATH